MSIFNGVVRIDTVARSHCFVVLVLDVICVSIAIGVVRTLERLNRLVVCHSHELLSIHQHLFR